jgi:microcystin degradation protein MlrC
VSFLPQAASYADFEQVALRGTHIVDALRGTNTVMGGFIDICEREGMAMLPIVHAALGAVGPATDEAVERYAREIADAVAAEGEQLDGVLLFLHGACWAASYPDAEAFIIGQVRAALGPGKPLMVALDYHGNIDADTLQGATAAFAYHKSPHTDTGDTGRRAALCMARTLRREIHPVWAVAKPGVLVPSIFSATALQPLAALIEEGRRIEAESETYVDISLMAGFSYADAHNTGFAVLCVTDGDQARAAEIATRLSARIRDAAPCLVPATESLWRSCGFRPCLRPAGDHRATGQAVCAARTRRPHERLHLSAGRAAQAARAAGGRALRVGRGRRTCSK